MHMFWIPWQSASVRTVTLTHLLSWMPQSCASKFLAANFLSATGGPVNVRGASQHAFQRNHGICMDEDTPGFRSAPSINACAYVDLASAAQCHGTTCPQTWWSVRAVWEGRGHVPNLLYYIYGTL